MKDSGAEASFTGLSNGREDKMGGKGGARGRTAAFSQAMGDEEQIPEDSLQKLLSVVLIPSKISRKRILNSRLP